MTNDNILGGNIVTQVNKPNRNLLGNNVCTKVNQENNNILGNNVSTSTRQTNANNNKNVLGNNVCTKVNQNQNNNPNPNNNILNDNVSTLSNRESDIALGAICTTDADTCVLGDLCPNNCGTSDKVCVRELCSRHIITGCPLDEDIIRYPSDKEN